MKRRQILAVVGSGAALLPFGTHAQSKHARVGVLIAVGQTPEYLASVADFETVLGQAGWHKGDNLEIDVRWSAGVPDRMQEAIAEIVAARPDVILAQSEAVTKALMAVRPAAPIVFVHVADPIASGLAMSLQPTRFQLIINRRIAKEFGLEISPMMLGEADKVLEQTARTGYGREVGGMSSCVAIRT